MKKFWKTYCGRCIHRTFNGISVHQNLLFRWLIFDEQKVIQTLIHRYRPQQYGLRYIPHLTIAVSSSPANCCLLGLGGGGVAHTLEHRFRHKGHQSLDAIEYDANIVRLATDYFMLSSLKRTTVIQQDAYQFVQQTEKRYQHLLIDLYTSEGFPTHCHCPDFFIHCKRLLDSEGTLAINLANPQNDINILFQLKDLFSNQTLCLPVPGTANLIVLAYQGHAFRAFLNQLPLKQLIWDPHWGPIGVVS